MKKQYEFKWEDVQVWENRAYVTADSPEEAQELFDNEKYDHPIDSRFSHYTEYAKGLEIKEYSIVDGT